jgi:hypothetical protein
MRGLLDIPSIAWQATHINKNTYRLELTMTSSFTAKADETTAQILDTVAKVQDATLEAVTTAANNVPDVSKFVAELPKFDFEKFNIPTVEEVAAAYYSFVEQITASSKSFTDRFIAASKPALAV